MIHLSIKFLFLIAAIKWGDWKHWKLYYSTILFYILGDLFYHYLFYHYLLWDFGKEVFPVLHSKKLIVFSFMFIRYPATVLIYLGKFPTGKAKMLLWYLFWVMIYVGIEWFDLKLGLIEHHHGWNLWWSLMFDLILFLVLKIHFHRPITAWLLSVLFSVILWNLIDIPLSVLK